MIMPEVRFGENNEVYEKNTNKLIGHFINGAIVPIKEAEVKNEEPVSVKQEDVKTPIENKIIENKSSFIEQRTKFEITKDSFFTIKFGLFETEGRFVPVKPEAVYTMDDTILCWVKF